MTSFCFIKEKVEGLKYFLSILKLIRNAAYGNIGNDLKTFN
jgi:hypothetical protein